MSEEIIVTIELGNDAMMTEPDVAAALRDLANRIEDGLEPEIVRDINGNTVGSVEYRH